MHIFFCLFKKNEIIIRSDFESTVHSPTLQSNIITIRGKYIEVLMELRDCGISHYTYYVDCFSH